jgi:hypothetical protein
MAQDQVQWCLLLPDKVASVPPVSHVINLGTRRRETVNFKVCFLIPGENASGTRWVRNWVAPKRRAGRGGKDKIPASTGNRTAVIYPIGS